MKLKKFFSVLLSLTILASICAPCYAADIQSADISPEVQSQMLRILSSVEHEKDNYGLTSIDFSSIEIGSPIPSYKVQNGALSASDIQLIPLLSEGKLVSIFYVATLPDGEYYVQLSNELVSSIEAYSSSNSFAIIYDDFGAYIYDNSTLHLLGEAETMAYSAEDIIQHTYMFPSQIISYPNSTNSLSESSNSISCLASTELSAIKPKPIAVNTTLNVEHFTESLASPMATSSAYLPVEIIQQPSGTHICWAIAVTSIVNYIFNASNTYEGIVQLFNGGQDTGMVTENIFYRFNEVFHTVWLYEYTTKINPSLILTYLNAGYPLYGDFSRTGGAHAVVIRGVNSSTRTFSVMNPNPTTSGYTSGTFSSSNVLTFISGYSGSSYTLRSYAFPGEI